MYTKQVKCLHYNAIMYTLCDITFVTNSLPYVYSQPDSAVSDSH